MADFAAILTPGRVLTEADVLALAEALEPRWQARSRRLALRDAAIREAAALFPDRARTAVAAAVARHLDRHIAGRATPDTTLFARIAALNDGAPVGSRTVFNIISAGGTVMKKSHGEIS